MFAKSTLPSLTKLQRLNEITLYGESNHVCRRSQMLTHLGEDYKIENCARSWETACDNCYAPSASENVTATAETIVNHVESMNPNENVTLIQLANILVGSADAALKKRGNVPLKHQFNFISIFYLQIVIFRYFNRI